MGENELRILQVNIGRSKQASNETVERAAEVKIPIILMQEPYTYQNKAAALGRYANCVICANKPDEVPWASVIILNDDYTGVLIKNVSTAHCVCVHITGPAGSFYVISLYCQYSQDIETFLQQLDKVLDIIGTNRVIIGADMNAVSPLWCWRLDETSMRQVDNRSSSVEDLITRRNLIVANRPHELCTYTRGNKDIDVTLTDDRTAIDITNWKVIDDWISSDHRPILVTINGDVTRPKIKERRYNLMKADWKEFEKKIRNNVERLAEPQLTTNEDIDILVKWVTKTMHKSAKGTIPKKRSFQKSVPWWNQELTTIKRRVNTLRRQYQQQTNEDQRRIERSEYRKARREYTRNINQTRRNSLIKFVEETSQKDPYGFIYKMLNNKVNAKKALVSINKEEGQTRDWQETATALLRGFFGEPTEQDDEVQIEHPQETPSTQDQWSIREIEMAVKSMKNKKAPGIDMVETEMIKHATKAGMSKVLTKLYNGCKKLGYFPKAWKIGVIRVLLKADDKDPSDVKSYRPICLLPILSKILERLIRYRLYSSINDPCYASDRQYGYRRKRGTEEAIADVIAKVKESESNLVLALLFDVTGAFDHLRWSSINKELQRRNTRPDLRRIVHSYLKDRKATLIDNYESVTLSLHQGCPQGSILGPDFWNICLDPLLKKLEEEMGAQIAAYADDLIILVEGASRKELEVEGQKLVDVVYQWTQEQGLMLSKTKTEMILLNDESRALTGKPTTGKGHTKKLMTKGNLGKSLIRTGKGGKRPPTIKIEGKGIKYSDTVRYLGVTIGTRLTISQHVQNVGTKAKRLFQKLAVFTRANWGLKFVCLKTLYEGVFIPILLYAAGAWGCLVSPTVAQVLNKQQRAALVPMARAYRTVSTEALQVLTGCIPMDLLLRERRLIFDARQRRRTGQGDDEDDRKIDEIKTQLRNTTISEWQDRWEKTTKGRRTAAFLPNVKERLGKTWIKPDHYNTQMLTGHGNFKDYLKRFGIIDENRCMCMEDETVDHIILACRIYDEERDTLIQARRLRNKNWPPEGEKELVDDRESLKEFTQFSKAVLTKKKNLEEISEIAEE